MEPGSSPAYRNCDVGRLTHAGNTIPIPSSATMALIENRTPTWLVLGTNPQLRSYRGSRKYLETQSHRGRGGIATRVHRMPLIPL